MPRDERPTNRGKRVLFQLSQAEAKVISCRLAVEQVYAAVAESGGWTAQQEQELCDALDVLAAALADLQSAYDEANQDKLDCVDSGEY